jgi:hypothetical protein
LIKLGIVGPTGHFAHGQVHRCSGLPNIKVKGEPVLDFGVMVQFTMLDHWGKPMRHVVPVEWCVPCERPNLSKRVR